MLNDRPRWLSLALDVDQSSINVVTVSSKEQSFCCVNRERGWEWLFPTERSNLRAIFNHSGEIVGNFRSALTSSTGAKSDDTKSFIIGSLGDFV